MDPFDADRIEKLRSKGVKKLFIPLDSEDAYLAYSDEGLDQAQDTSQSLQTRGGVVADSLYTDAENALHNVQTEAG